MAQKAVFIWVGPSGRAATGGRGEGFLGEERGREREGERERERRAATMKEVIYVVHTGLY